MTGTRKRRVSGRLAATRQKASDASAHHPTLQAGPGLLRKRMKMTSTRLGDALKGSLSIPRPCASTGWERSSQTMPPAPRKAGGRPGCSMRSLALTLIRDAGCLGGSVYAGSRPGTAPNKNFACRTFQRPALLAQARRLRPRRPPTRTRSAQKRFLAAPDPAACDA